MSFKSPRPQLDHVPPSPSSNQSINSLEEKINSPQISNPPQTPKTTPLPTMPHIIEELIDYDQFLARHVADVALQLSLVLTEIIKINDQVPFSTSKLTRFHSRAPPGISIKDYLLRIIKFCNLEKAVLLSILYLNDLFTKSYEKFVLNSLTVHRFLITACTVAAKGLCDQFCSNTHYAKVGGLSVMELNLLEVEFLTRVRYRIVPPFHLLGKYDKMLTSKTIEPTLSLQAQHQSQPIPPPTSNRVKEVPQQTNAMSKDDNKKHPREDKREESDPVPPGKPSGNKGFKAMRETFKFLKKI